MALIAHNTPEPPHKQYELGVHHYAYLYVFYAKPSPVYFATFTSARSFSIFNSQIGSWHVNALDTSEREMSLLKFGASHITLCQVIFHLFPTKCVGGCVYIYIYAYTHFLSLSLSQGVFKCSQPNQEIIPNRILMLHQWIKQELFITHLLIIICQ